jgi:hypothetical protein
MAEVIAVSDSRIDLFQDEADKEVNVIFQGADRITPTVINATSYSTNQVQFQLFSPSLKSMLTRDPRVRFDVQFDIVGDGTFQPLFDAPRRLPINSALNSIQLNINGSSQSINPYQILSALMEYENDAKYRVEQLSGSASMPDQYQNYNDWQIYGSARSELASFGANVNEISRGGYDGGLARHLSNGGKTARYTFTEPLFIGGLAQKSGETCLSNINTISITLQFVADIFNKLWSSASSGSPDPYVGSSVVVSFPTIPTILYDVLTPDPRSVSRISRDLTYPYTFFQPYSRNYTMLAGQTMTQVSDPIRLQSIPRSVYIFIRRNFETQRYNQTDTFCAISNVSVSFNNQASLLSTASPLQLYQYAVNNGYNRSFTESQNFTGLVLKLEFAKDIGLPYDLSPNIVCYNTLSVQCTFTNLSTSTEDMTFVVMPATDGSLVVSGNKADWNVGNLTMEMVKVANDQDVKLTENEYEASNPKDQPMSGGRNKAMKKMKHIRQLAHKRTKGRGMQSADSVNSGVGYGSGVSAGALVRYGDIPSNLASQIEEIDDGYNNVDGGKKKKAGRPKYMTKSRG